MPIFEIRKPDDVEVDQERLIGALTVAPNTQISGGIHVSRKRNEIILNVGTTNPDAVRTAVRRLFPVDAGFTITELPSEGTPDHERLGYTGPSQSEIEAILVDRGI